MNSFDVLNTLSDDSHPSAAQDRNMKDFSSLLGLEFREAERRLRDVGAEVFVEWLYGKKGKIENADSDRVIRVRPAVSDDGRLTIGLLLSSFCTNI